MHYHSRTRVFMGLSILVLGLGMLATAVHAQPEPQVTLCHYPPGNPSNAQEITVGASAVPAHLAHGDFVGPCAQDCRRHPAVCNDTNVCTTDTCNTSNGTCGHTFVNCDDNNFCTSDSCDASLGCVYAQVVCDDGTQCTTDACDPTRGCVQGTVSCDDQNACTIDSCDDATGCAQKPMNCDDHNACTIDSCDPSVGCVYAQGSCDDGSQCTTDACDPSLGCVYAQVVCDDGTQCTTDACDPTRGCVQGTVSCDDQNACTIDSCDDATGCAHIRVECDPGQTCDSGTGFCRTLPFTLVQTFSNNCFPINYRTFVSADLSFPSFNDAFVYCALQCEADSACVQIFVAYVDGTSKTGPYACLTGGGDPTQTWDSSEFQCSLPYPPYQQYGEWYNRVQP